ncbi:MAG: DNA translocase FtsK [Alphaproteobacteria bacterium]|nr:DNA translocase FtsK [Alphaproteobacteria bacterium]
MYQKEKKVHFFPEAFRVFLKARSLELLGLSLLALSGFFFLSLLTYDRSDASVNVISSLEHFKNALGQNGAYIADFFMQYIGWASYIIPLCISFWGFLTLAHYPLTKPFKRLFALGIAVLLLSLAGATIVMFMQGGAPQGVIALTIALKLFSLFDRLAMLPFLPVVAGLFFAGCAVFFLYATSLSFSQWQSLALTVSAFLKTSLKILGWIWTKWQAYTSLKPKKQEPERPDSDLAYDSSADHSPEHHLDDCFVLNEEAPQIEHTQKTTPRKTFKKPAPLSLKDDESYTLPSLDLLQDSSAEQKTTLTKRELEENIERLAQVLTDYGVQGQIVGAKPGPVVTLYELEPAPGIKSSRIIGLADDIARSMHALSARIAVVPGKNLIGIELPNATRQTVYLQDLLASKGFDDSSAKLNLALGKNISGSPVLTDLAGMPHMIVAGTTGSGKSVGINAMILSLLYRHSPETCRLILIDPKMLEFSMYNDIPHLLTPVVTEPGKAVFALKWAVREMENRYRGMSHLGVRNIENYNTALKQAAAEGREITRTVQTGFNPETGQPTFEEQPINMKPLPYIVVIVDEMADLMMVAGKDIESAVQRLAQMARAAGIHVIMATQRPSVDVITGTIKANFPTRISFQVTSKFDSRTILGEQGAEQLLGRGDMLFMEAGGRIQRIHGPFVSDEEVERIVTFLKSQGSPDYMSNVCDESGDLGMEALGGNSGEDGDDLYMKAVAIVRHERKASTSFIQRRLQIGYNRAARVIEQMEAANIVTPANHVGKREIIIDEAG